MSPGGDDDGDMKAIRYIHDDVIDAIIRGEPVHEVHAPLAVFARQVRALADEPAPAPSPELVALLADPAGADVSAMGGRPGRKRMPGIDSLAGATSKVASLGLIAKLGLGASLAAAGVAGAGAAGMLPAAATEAVRGAIEVVSPVDFGTSDHTPDNHGTGVSADAKGDSDGVSGVDGSTGASGSAKPDAPPGQTGETGLTRANQTPAAPHAPDVAPSTVPDHAEGNGTPGSQSDDRGTPPSTVPDHGGPDGPPTVSG